MTAFPRAWPMAWLVGVLVGCGGPAEPTPLRMLAASDLRFALPAIVARFADERPDLKVDATFGASGTLCTQIEHGAPCDLFLSASTVEIDRLLERRLADPATRTLYAVGGLVLWVPESSPLDVRKGRDLLLDPRVRRIALADPVHAPYGRAAKAFLVAGELHEAVAPKLVYGENVAQAFQFVESGAADVGLISRGLVEDPKLRGRGRWWSVPTADHPPLEQCAIVPTSARSPAEAAALLAFLRGPIGTEVLRRYGFGIPAGTRP